MFRKKVSYDGSKRYKARAVIKSYEQTDWRNICSYCEADQFPHIERLNCLLRVGVGPYGCYGVPKSSCRVGIYMELPGGVTSSGGTAILGGKICS